MNRPTIVILFLFILIQQFVSADHHSQGKNIVFGKTVTMFSKILKEERPIHVYLPAGYEGSQARYPVLYLTDGSLSAFKYFTGAIQYYCHRNFPKFIVVGIPNTNRTRDLTANQWEQLSESGGGKHFLEFITDELIPWADGSFRTTGFRLIAGFSSGGHFVLYTLFLKPEYFDAYIAASASNPDQHYMMELARKFVQSNRTAEKYLFLPYFEGDFTICTQSVPVIIDFLRRHMTAGFRCKVKTYPGMGHVPLQGLLDGLFAIFEDWHPVGPPVITPSGGEFLSGDPMTVELSSSEDEIRYTMDGREPTRESLLYSGPIVIRKSTEIKAKSFRKNLAESRVTVGNYKSHRLRPSQKNMKGLKNGLSYRYFEQQWPRLPDEIDAVPVDSGVASTIDVSRRRRDQGFLFQFDGYIKIPESGAYCFYLRASARRKLIIGEKMLMEHSSRGEITESNFQLVLEKGFHPIRVLYTNCWMPRQYLELRYRRDSGDVRVVSEDMLFHR